MCQKVCKKCGSWIIKIPTLESSILCHICYPLDNFAQSLMHQLMEKKMFECCNHLKAPYKGLGCFKELSISIDETLKAPDYDTFLKAAENLHLKIKQNQNEIIKYFLVTYFALDNEHYENNKDAMRLFLSNNSITIKTEFDPTSTGFVTKISFNQKPNEKIEREKKLLLEINRLEKHISNLKDELASINEY